MNTLYKVGTSAIVLATVALASCSKDNGQFIDEPIIKDIPKEEFQKKESIISFLTKEIDKVNPGYAPEVFYREVIKSSEIEELKKEMWEHWVESNRERMGQISEWHFEKIGTRFGGGSSEGGTGSAREMIWTIPEEEVMPIVTIAKGEQPEKGYPMFINLHGGGSYPNTPTPHGSSVNREEYIAAQRLALTYEDAPSFYFVPRMSDDRKGRWHYMPQRFVYRKAFQMAVLSGKVDPNRYYLTGVSEGGYGTLRVSLFMPDYFAAVGVLAAADNPNSTAVNLRNLPFRMEVGTEDNGYSRNLYGFRWQDKMKELKAQSPDDYVHVVNMQEGRDHLGTRYFDITPWMIKFKRNTYPKHVTYEYYNIHPSSLPWQGGYSDGVYYLDFRKLKPDTNKARLLIDVVKEGNIYTVNTEETKDSVTGELGIYLKDIDYSNDVVVIHNRKEVFKGKVKSNRGVAMESIALFGDPERVFTSKVSIKL